MIYYRIQDKQDSVKDLLRPDRESYLWVGDTSDARRGVSVTRTKKDLIRYFSRDGRKPRSFVENLKDAVLVKLEGEPSPDEDHDHDQPGDPLLILPSRILSVRPLNIEEIVSMMAWENPARSLSDQADRYNELYRAGFPRKELEKALPPYRESSPYPYDDLDDLLRDPEGSYTVGWDKKGRQLIWHHARGEYDVVS